MSLYSEVKERVEALRVADTQQIDSWWDLASELLGSPGVMLSGSKRAPEAKRVVWNGNVLVDRIKVWYGDISLRDKEQKLQALANETGKTVHVLREMDCRFEYEQNPQIQNAVASYEPQS